ncbi:MAG: CDP-alcohol phosphatidyltransferase family protein [Dysgonomonas sp.]
MENQKTPTLESTLKSSDTEEFIDIHFYRPLGYKWALLFQKLGISPNAVTVFSIILGIGAGICFYFDNIWITILGIVLLIWANSYDSADGQLARMTKKFSPIGRALDGFAGDLWFASIYAAICLRLYPVWGISIWALALITGSFHARQAAMADYYRNIHLLFVNGKKGSELDNSTELTEKFDKETFKNNWFNKIYLFSYRSYTKGQENWTPNFQNFMKLLKEKYSESTFPEKLRNDFRSASLPLMKWANILSFNTRAIVLCISLLIKEPWIYFVFELTVLNGILVYMVNKHEKMCKQFIYKIENGEYV